MELTQCRKFFSNTTLTVEYLINKIATGELGLPELQRPFVWKDTKVRDLFDSMMRGYPIGYLMLWECPKANKRNQLVPITIIIANQKKSSSTVNNALHPYTPSSWANQLSILISASEPSPFLIARSKINSRLDTPPPKTTPNGYIISATYSLLLITSNTPEISSNDCVSIASQKRRPHRSGTR